MIREPELSIIVPVYNVEEYLGECIDSILSQTYKDYELILIDDGSTDGSGQICDSFTDERIRIFHIENGGVSNARNIGLKNARGQYITFIDSDDMYGDFNTIALNIARLKEDPDIEIVQFPIIQLHNNIREVIYSCQPIKLKESDVFKEWYRFSDYYNPFVWCKIFKKEILNGVSFPIGKVAEDAAFCLQLMKKATCVCTTQYGQYVYRNHSNSITHSILQKETFCYDDISILSEIYENATHYKELRTHRLSFLMFSFIWYMEIKTAYPNHDYSTIQRNFYCHKLRFHDIWWYITKNNERIDNRYKPRYKKNILAFYLFGHLYEWLYCTFLRIKMKGSIQK